MKHIKKIAALVLAIAMVLSISAVTFAADDIYTGDSKTTTSAGTTGTYNIPIVKGIVIFNTDGSRVREPNVVYTYTATPADVADTTTVTDKDNDSTHVLKGVAGAVASATITFADKDASNNPVYAESDVNGKELEKTANLVVSMSDGTNPYFTRAGIYRYLITETVAPNDVSTVGLDARDNDAYITTRYLDVYVSNVKTSADGVTPEVYELKVTGAVIFKTQEATSGNKGKDAIDENFEKTTGFEPAKDPSDGTYSYENDKTVDKYHTFNLEVNKTTTGGLADKTWDFPFEITLTGNKAATIVADYSKVGASYDGTEPTTVDINTNAKVLKPKLSNGDSVKITGIPVGTTVLVKETNTTVDSYTPSITTQTGFSGLALTETNALTPQTGTTQLSTSPEINDKTQNSVIGLTNNLAEVSPTGYVVRIAPYVLMLAGGIALLVVTRRRREDAQAA